MNDLGVDEANWAGLSVSDTVRGVDGSGTSIFSGIGPLLGVPTRGFHLDFSVSSAIGCTGVLACPPAVDVKEFVPRGLIRLGGLSLISRKSDSSEDLDESRSSLRYSMVC